MRNRTTLFALGMLFILAASAQARTHATVTAALDLSVLPRGKSGVIAVVTNVNPGLHAQSAKPLDPNLYPFSLKVDPNNSVELQLPIYPTGQISSMVCQTISVYIGRAIVFIPFTVKADAPVGPIRLSG